MARTRVFLPIAVALVFAVVGAVIAYKWAQSQKPTAVAQRASVSGDIINVAVAAATIPWGTKLSTETIQMKAFLRESLPVGYFTDPAVLTERVSITPLEVGDIILESRLAPVGVTSGGIAAVVTPGSRAIAVKGDKVVGLSGLIKPRDRVDVLVTINDSNNRQKAEPITKVVLENILVLAAGPQMQKAEKGESPVDVYTLEVTPEEAERLGLAANEGVLHFALRNITDSEIVLTRGATVAETLDSYRTHVASPDVQMSEPQAGYYSVEVIRGTSRTNVDF
jgi:pilus assembly protein CpaB